jgi:hypothetical protein
MSLPFSCKPLACGHAACLPARMGRGGKSGIVALARASGRSPPHGGGYFRFGNERARPLVFPSSKQTEAVSLPSAATRHKDGTLARRNADGRPARGPVGQRVSGRASRKRQAGQLKNAAPLGARSAGQSASSIFPVHQTPLLIVTRMGRDYRPGSRQRIEQVARRAAPITCANSLRPRTVRFRSESSRGEC